MNRLEILIIFITVVAYSCDVSYEDIDSGEFEYLERDPLYYNDIIRDYHYNFEDISKEIEDYECKFPITEYLNCNQIHGKEYLPSKPEYRGCKKLNEECFYRGNCCMAPYTYLNCICNGCFWECTEMNCPMPIDPQPNCGYHYTDRGCCD